MESSPIRILSSATVEHLGWLEGKWIGRHDTGLIEMHWSSPAAGSIMGMFRWVAMNRLYFCELLLIEKEQDSVVLRLKNFDSGFREWEIPDEPMTFDLVVLGINQCIFDLRTLNSQTSLLYELEGADVLHVRYQVEGGPPESRYEFRFHRAA